MKQSDRMTCFETVRASIALLHEANDAPDMAIRLLERKLQLMTAVFRSS